MRADNLRISKLSLFLHMGASKPKLWAIKYLMGISYKHPVKNQSFWAVSISKLLSWFLTYLRWFKSKSQIHWHHWKAEIQGFHLTPSIMGLQALLMKILALKKSARFVGRTCTYRLLIQFPGTGTRDAKLDECCGWNLEDSPGQGLSTDRDRDFASQHQVRIKDKSLSLYVNFLSKKLLFI